MKDKSIDPDLFRLDKDRLDAEWEEQPGLFFRYAEKLADAREKVEEAKAQLDLVCAELDKEIRLHPEQFGLEKLTETIVSHCVVRQDRYQLALRHKIEAEHAKDLVQAIVSALDHRKSALERLVALHGQNYFSSPTVPKESRERVEEKRQDKAFGKRKRVQK